METWNNILKKHMVLNGKVMNIKVVELIKSHEYKSCRTHQFLQLLFWSYFHVTKFEQFKF